jgi:predicted Zn-dependent peptidase
MCIAVLIGLVPALGSAEAIRNTTPAGRVFHYVQMPEADRTAIVIDWKSTWAHGAEHPTTARMGAILMTIGGPSGTLEELIGELNAAGAHAELNATADGARGLLVARAGQLEEAAALVREALTNPRLDAESFESIRAELSRAVRATEPSAEALVSDAAQRLLIGDAPLDDFLRLRVDDIEGATLSEVHAWRDAVFAQANVTVAAAGEAPAADVAVAVDTLLERLPEFPAGEPATTLQPAYGGRTVLIVAPDMEGSAFGVFGPLPTTGKLGGVLNVLALEALNRRLAWRLRREFGDAYDISARPANYARDVRLLAIGAEVAAADVEEVLGATREIYEWFRGRGPTPREVARGARHAARMFEGVQETPEAMAQIMAELVLDGELVTVADDLPAQLRRVTPRRLRAHVRKAFPNWNEMLRIIVSPSADAAQADCMADAIDALRTCR